MREPAYRLYNCERCQVQVRICERCDHGNGIAPASARRSAAASRSDELRRGIRGAAAVRGGTPPGSAGGASGNDKSKK